MGQRLVLSVYENFEDDETPVACIYYHWGGYTDTAINIAEDLLNTINEILETYPDYCIYQALYKAVTEYNIVYDEWSHTWNTGGFSASADIDLEKNECPKLKAMLEEKPKIPVQIKQPQVDRNLGLIAFSDDNQMKLKDWSECDVLLDVTTATIDITYAVGRIHIDNPDIGYYLDDGQSDTESDEDEFVQNELDRLPKMDISGFKTFEEAHQISDMLQQDYIIDDYDLVIAIS